jgi:hypothetical protein
MREPVEGAAVTDEAKIQIDGARPATLNDGAGSQTDFATLEAAVAAWRALPSVHKIRATVKVIGGPVYAAHQIDRLHYVKSQIRRDDTKEHPNRNAANQMADDLTDLEIAVLCDLLQGPHVNLRAHKRLVLDQLVSKGLVEPANNGSSQYQLSEKAHHILAERGVGIGEG